ncbi:hypothetical protein CRUP_012400 [Coryphaenoides rupestris]|nr:hypothetical protein CRUP_012400 [Coryphaenoides rupestris]
MWFLALYFYSVASAGFVVDGRAGAGVHRKETVDMLARFSLAAAGTTNASVTVDDESRCPTLHIGHFAEEFSVLMEVLSRQREEESSLLTLLDYDLHLHLQIRLGPRSLTYTSTQHRDYEYVPMFSVGGLQDGQWHRVSVGVSVWGLEVYVDCSLVESVRWAYRRQGISTQGLVMLGGILESFETPFEGAMRQLTLVMGDPDAARQHCTLHAPACLRTATARAPRTELSRRDSELFSSAYGSGGLSNTVEGSADDGENDQLADGGRVVESGAERGHAEAMWFLLDMLLAGPLLLLLLPPLQEPRCLAAGTHTGSQENPLLQSIPIEVTHEGSLKPEADFPLVEETNFLHEGRGRSNAKLPEVIQTSDGNLGKNPWEIFRSTSDATAHDIIELDGTTQHWHNGGFYAEDHVIPSVESVPLEHGETARVIGSLLPLSANDSTVAPGPAVQRGDAVPAVAGKDGEVIVVGSDNRKYRLLTGPPGPGRAGGEGDAGLVGDKGSKGLQGLEGRRGDPGPPGPPGLPTLYLSSNSKEDWAAFSTEPGDVGAIGETGRPGAPGQRGLKGETGTLGEKGDEESQDQVGIEGMPEKRGLKAIKETLDPSDLWENQDMKVYMVHSEQSALPGSQGSSDHRGSTGLKETQGRRVPEVGGALRVGVEFPVQTGILEAQAQLVQQGSEVTRGRGVGGALVVQDSLVSMGYLALWVTEVQWGQREQKESPVHRALLGPLVIPGLKETGAFLVWVVSEDRPLRSEVWASQGIQEVDGPQGPVGMYGYPGAVGLVGIRGHMGQQGLTGLAGERGPPGPQGASGSAGNIGPAGLGGPQGDPGSQGLQGLTGPKGQPGPEGTQGPLGARGAEGKEGEFGDFGIMGDPGLKGQKVFLEGLGTMDHLDQRRLRGFQEAEALQEHREQKVRWDRWDLEDSLDLQVLWAPKENKDQREDKEKKGGDGPSGRAGKKGHIGKRGKRAKAGSRGLRGVRGEKEPLVRPDPWGDLGLMGSGVMLGGGALEVQKENRGTSGRAGGGAKRVCQDFL